MRRTLACAFALSLLLCGAAIAQVQDDPATKEDVQQLFNLTNTQKQAAAVSDALRQQMPTLVAQLVEQQLPDATPEEKEKMNAFVSGLYEQMFRSAPIQEMMEAVKPVYQRKLSHSDIQQLIQFYASPLGQKVLNVMPEITAEALQAEMPVLQKWMSEQTQQLQKQTEQFARGLREEKPKDEKHSGPRS